MPIVNLTVNGTPRRVEVAGDELLLDVLRERAGCGSVREGCGVGACGTCTAIVDGAAVATCLTLAGRCEGATVLTTEGLAPDDPLVAAFVGAGAMQCGYCIPGFVLMVRDLLAANRDPSSAEIDEHLAGNLCRCGAYLEIREAVRRAAAGGDGGPA
jgi:aerobic-type carbon monoxide dehydrogenase small subunit (CoxS/CutS family)